MNKKIRHVSVLKELKIQGEERDISKDKQTNGINFQAHKSMKNAKLRVKDRDSSVGTF